VNAQSVPDPALAPQVMVVSLMKSGTHLIQELMVALGYGAYGSSRIPAEIRPVLDADTRRRIAGLVYDADTCARLEAGAPADFEKATDEAWAALGLAWQLRLGAPLENRYGLETTDESLVQQALHRSVGSSFSDLPAPLCWVATELDIKKADGQFLREWAETGSPRIIFMYRDPRDTLLSMVNFLSGKTANGFGNYSDFQVFNGILTGRPELSDKLSYALADPSFPGNGDHERALWLLNHPNVCKVSFEELVGPSGGGSARAQLAAVTRVVDFVGAGADPAELTGQLYRRDSFTFFKGQIGSWRESFTAQHKAQLADRLGTMVDLYGYSS
jgi:hypothetical protein